MISQYLSAENLSSAAKQVLRQLNTLFESIIYLKVHQMKCTENIKLYFSSGNHVHILAALKIMGVQHSNTAEKRSLNAQDGVTLVTLNAMDI